MLPQAWIFPIEDHSIHILATAARLIHDSRFTLLDDITSTVVSMIKAVSPELCKHIISQSTQDRIGCACGWLCPAAMIKGLRSSEYSFLILAAASCLRKTISNDSVQRM